MTRFRPRPGARTAVALAALALVSSQGWAARVAAPGSAAAAGVTRFLEAQQWLSGVDGERWHLRVLASISDPATADTSALYLVLGRCLTMYHCALAGAWQVPVRADQMSVAGDLSQATVTAAVGSTSITITLHAAPGSPVMPFTGLGYDAELPPTPTVAAGTEQVQLAAGTLSVGGRTCGPHGRGPIYGRVGAITGASTESDPALQIEWYAHSSEFAAAPKALPPGFVRGGTWPFECLAPYEVPYGGQRVVTGAGAYSGRIHVPAGGSVNVDGTFVGIANGDRGYSYSMIVLKRIGERGLKLKANTQWVPPMPFALSSGGLGTGRVGPGTYTFVLASDHGAQVRFAGTRNVRVTVHRDSHVHVLRKQVGSTGPTTLATAQKIELPLTVTPSTYAFAMGTEIVPDHLLPPVDTVDITVCFRPASGGCTGYWEQWQSNGTNYNGAGYPAEVSPNYAAVVPGSGFPDGPAYASLTYKGTDTGDPLDLICLIAELP